MSYYPMILQLWEDPLVPTGPMLAEGDCSRHQWRGHEVRFSVKDGKLRMHCDTMPEEQVRQALNKMIRGRRRYLRRYRRGAK